MSASIARAFGLFLVALIASCGSAKNTPEQAFADLKKALAEQRWDLLYDILPPKKQQDFDQQVAAFEQRITMLKNTYGEKEVEAQVKKDIGMSFADWQKLDKKHRLVKLWGTTAKDQLVELNINPAEIENSTVKETTITGDKAEVSLDDGKGHRSRLTFVLVDEYWRFDLEKGG